MSSAAVSAYSARSRASDRYAHQQSRVVTIYDNFYRYKKWIWHKFKKSGELSNDEKWNEKFIICQVLIILVGIW